MNQIQKDMKRYVKNALNRSLTKIAKEQRCIIRKECLLSNKKIRNLTKTSRASNDKLEISIKSLKANLSINNFKKREENGGVRVKVGANKELFFKGAFIAVRRGKKKKSEKKNSGFILTRNVNNSNGFSIGKANIKSYVRTATKIYERSHSDINYIYTKKFSLISKDAINAMKDRPIKIFQQELAKE